MASCEEAKYFFRSCPGTKMDGDNDGVPCEAQWCGGRQDATRRIAGEPCQRDRKYPFGYKVRMLIGAIGTMEDQR